MVLSVSKKKIAAAQSSLLINYTLSSDLRIERRLIDAMGRLSASFAELFENRSPAECSPIFASDPSPLLG